MSSKKVSDLYCYRHDSETCGCREQLALPNVDYTKFEFVETPPVPADAVRRDVLAFMRVEHDAGDEDLCGERFDLEGAVKRVPVPAAVIPILGFAWSAFALSFPFPIGDTAEMHTAHGVFLYVNDSANHDPGDENPRDYSVT